MLAAEVEKLGVRVIEADEIEDCSFSFNGIGVLSEIFKAERPDVVHTHASLSARIAARMNKIKVVHTRHCLEEEKKGIKRLVYRVINNCLSDRVIAVSEAVSENLSADGIKGEKLRCVYNGITPLREISEEEKNKIKASYGIRDGATVVGIVARLEPVKNQMMFLEAAKVVSVICPEAVFMVVGDGSMRAELEKKASEDGIADRVIFTGYIKDVNDVMNIIDIHTLTSDREALSISLIEALSLGKAVVATDSGGPREVVENGVSGLLVNTNDAVSFTMAVVRLIQRPDIRAKLGEEGRKRVRERFMSAAMANNIEDIYKELVQEEKNG